MIVRFANDEKFDAFSIMPEGSKPSDGLIQLCNLLNEEIQKGRTFDFWSESTLGGLTWRLDEMPTDDERYHFFQTTSERALDLREIGWQTMEEGGVVRVEIKFSGGNDEGSCDSITVTYGDGSIKDFTDYAYGRGDSFEERLVDLMLMPMYDKYGSFAGEFYVDGMLVWDYESKTVKMSGSETVESYEDFEDEV